MTGPEIRRATEADVGAIVALLADDDLGAARESPADLAPYREAFAEIAADPSETLVVAVRDGRVVGTLQLSVLRGLSHRGARRGQIEAVRIVRDERGAGLGTTLVRWAIDEARERGCAVVQLTSHRTRSDAHRFYERLGFTATHEGFKRALR